MSIIAVPRFVYVGSPQEVDFVEVRKTARLGLSEEKIARSNRCIDSARGLQEDAIRAANHLTVTANPELLSDVD